MTLEYFLWIIAYLIIFHLSTALFIYIALKAKKSALLYSFLLLHLMTILWILRAMLCFVIISFIKDPQQSAEAFDLLNWKFGIFIGGLSSFAWLLFSLNYINYKHAENKRFILMLLMPTLFFVLTALTNRYHHFFVKDFVPGILFWLHASVAYLYSILGFAVLIRYAVRKKGYERKRSILLFIAYFIPFISSIINDALVQCFSFKPLLGYADSTPIGFTLGVALIALIIFKFRFLNIKNLALDKIVHNLKQAVVIVDTGNEVIAFNHSFMQTFPCCSVFETNKCLHCLTEFLKTNSDINYNQDILNAIRLSDCSKFQSILRLDNPDKKVYEVVIYPILNHDTILGRIISFEDVTQITAFTEELEEKNKALSLLNDTLIEKNKQLYDYAATAKELAVMRERNRISRDIHDTLGHTMTILITQLQVMDILCTANPVKAKEKVKESLDIARNGLNELRQNISSLMSENIKAGNLETAIKQLIAGFTSVGMEIDLSLSGDGQSLPSKHSEVLFRLCQEALTNAVRHGRATHIDIVLSFTKDKSKVFIKDNGCGCSEIKKGFGLKGMEERISDLGGIIQFGSDEESGFNIFAEIPLSEDNQHFSAQGGTL